MSDFFEIIPLDTLFFRGSSPMEAGQYSAVSLFPPPVSVLKGAFWTAYCKMSGLDFESGLVNGEIPIEVTGVFIKKDGKIYVPCPATWYCDDDEKPKNGADCNEKSLCVASDKSNAFEKLGMETSAGNVVFAVPKIDAKPLGGAWVNFDFIKNPKEAFDRDSVLSQGDIYSTESRTGVALDEKRRAKDGQLYTSTHIRLNEGISLVVALSSKNNVDFGESGKMLLGGEKRIVQYKKCAAVDFPKNENAAQYLSLVPIQATEENLNDLLASAKLTVTSGWDLKKGFHKDSVSWIPAGAVFNKKINDSCVSLGAIE